MTVTARRFLILHGFGNRRPRTHWEWWLTEQLRLRGEVALYPQMPKPEAPVLEQWLELLAAEWEQLGEGERIVICHSLACALWYQAAARGVFPEPADRVLFVAPAGATVLSRPEMSAFLPSGWCADVLRPSCRAAIRLVASDADPCCVEGPAAEVYGEPLELDSETLPGAGHITSADGFGPWPKVLEWCLDGDARFVEAPHRHVRDLIVTIDRSRRQRVGRQLEEQLRTAIRAGTLGPGAHLPSTRALAEDLRISRGVVMRAYAQLATEGYLDVRRGASPRVSASGRPAPSRAPRTPSRYDLRADLPDISEFPRAAWSRSLGRALSTASNSELADRGDRGLERLRVELSAYLRRARGVDADPERIVITGGGLQALGAVAATLARSGPSTLAIENPCNLLIREVVLASGLMVLPAAVDREGMVVERLGDARAALVSTINQFPTGVALSEARRAQLFQWLRAAPSRLLIEDDNEGELRLDRHAVRAVQSEARDSVAYVGSTAKTLAPALRMGWVVLPEGLIRPTVAELAKGKLRPTPIDQLAFADFLRSGEFDRHLRRLRNVYRRRRELLLDQLGRRLPDVAVSATGAGSHVVLELASFELEQVVTTHARTAGLLVQPLSQLALDRAGGSAGLVIGYASLPEPTIAAAVARLAAIVRTPAGSYGRATRTVRRAAPRGRTRASCCC